ncbi:MAG: hypothetical protein HOF74_02580 [Gammaproteobacteria bacterium]|jgi:hypothetical protein|nr:hypothetical protein [Gammaproteobacteria bacterium]MBT3858692.1 hypothetical protein [Gammaproteobacteria bacterium]MBT3986044.1 hypothetical protein [Gammaproteobacteria bacterium]MBT4254558.1 hypothetical protein [Gammaproteobacteria bacterium]MBT4580755.1 hypothetical protein [Gammaproteobacteria bacterium]
MSPEKVKTVDGRPTSLASLNTGHTGSNKQSDDAKPTGLRSRLTKAFKNLNLVMAGMYTGVGCVGTPHTEHSYEEDGEAEKESLQ